MLRDKQDVKFGGVMSAQNTHVIPAFLLCFCSISYINNYGYCSIPDNWFLVHYR